MNYKVIIKNNFCKFASEITTGFSVQRAKYRSAIKSIKLMRTLFVTLISILTLFSASAQTTQKGVVMEYNEKNKKTPLAGVEINVRNAASVISDQNGEFTLQFINLQPGDKINVRRIEKAGYEIFNKDAIAQWNLNPNNPFIIVMCRSDKFKKIHDNYEAAISANYKKQYDRELSTLNKLKADSNIDEEEYNKNLSEIQETYEKQLDSLDNALDRLSSLDLSELTPQEQEIIDLVNQGHINEAIEKYDKLHPESEYNRSLNQTKEEEDAIKRLQQLHESTKKKSKDILKAITNQIEVLKLTNDEANLEKALEIYRSLAELDNDDTEWLKNAGDDIHNNFKNNNLALVYYKKALINLDNETSDISLTTTICKKIAEIYRQLGDDKSASKYELMITDFAD